MSILDFPRLHFRGFARANVPTANRNTHGHIDIATNTVSMAGAPFDLSRAPSEFHEHLKQLPPRFDAAGKPDPEGIFSQAAGYNFGGNNHFSWENTRISGVELGAGGVDTGDALVGAKLALWGHYNDYLRTTFNRARWVDNNPAEPDTTLIYAGQFTLSGEQAGANTPSLFSADIGAAHSVRWLGGGHITERSGHFLDEEFGRVRLFQFSLAKHDPHFLFNPEVPLPASLCALRQALAGADVLGLTVQYALFNMSTPLQPDAPVFYDLAGSIGLWRRDELATYPAGRLLLPCQGSLGPVLVKLHADRVALNMPTAIPFTTRAANAVSEQHPTHALGGQQALGELRLEDEAGRLVARIPEALYLDYWRHHGVFDVPLQHAAAGALRLVSALARWEEADWVLQSDSNQLYLEAPNRQQGLEYPQTITLQSRFRGALADHPALAPRAEDGDMLALELQPSARGPGYAELRVAGRRPGATRVVLGEGRERQQIGVRVLPDDWHLDAVPAEQVDYAFLYRHVMGYYELVYPFMADKVFSLADRCKCETYARLMWQMCDPQNRDKSYYMPSTRELSQPKARLFLKYLTQVEAAAKTGQAAPPASAPAIGNKAELVEELKKAVDLELSLMLQYLYAAYSIPNYEQGAQLVAAGRWQADELELACGGADRRRHSGTRGTLLEIAHEEMIHYLLVNNVLMALGEPFYAGRPLLGEQARRRFGLDTEFAFEPFSEQALARFVRFEWPDYLPTPGKSVAGFYAAIRRALVELPQLFAAGGGRRGGEHHLFLKELTNRAYPAYQLEVSDRDSALFALDFVTGQGEGVALDSPHFATSHFHRLRELAGQFAARGKPFEPALPALKNPACEPCAEGCQVSDGKALGLMRLYQGAYELTFLLMAHHFAQQPAGSLRRSRLMNASIDIMTGVLRPLSAALMNMPSGLPGRNAGPPLPVPPAATISADYSAGCAQLAQKCLALAGYGRSLESGVVGLAPIEMLEFFNQQLTDLSRGTMSREA